MFFKNLHFYRFDEEFILSIALLNEALQERKARSCGSMELSCEGWTQPLGLDGQSFTHVVNNRIMLCLSREDKILPASLVGEKIAKKVFQIEQEQGRPVGRKEKMDIKDLIIQELLPRALVKTSRTFAYIDRENSWLVINAPSSSKAEEFISLLRKTLGTLNVVLPQTKMSPEVIMTQWLMGKETIVDGFEIEDEVELRSVGEKDSVIRCKHVDLSSDEVQAHISTGKRAFRLALNWRDRISFVLHDDLSIHRLHFNDELIEGYECDGDEIAQFDADFAIMGGELGNFIPVLLQSLSPSD